MSDASDAIRVPEQTAVVAAGQPPRGLEGAEARPGMVQARRGGQELDLEGMQLLSRFLMGTVLVGGDELMRRLRFFQEQIEAAPWLLAGEDNLDQESTTALLRYLAIGLYLRGQRRVGRGVQRGFRLALGTASWAFAGVNRLTATRLTRSLRRSASARMQDLADETVQIMEEGRHEEQNARLLAGQTIDDIIDDVLDYIAENPEMQASIRHLIGQQSVGLANVVTDNARSLGASADDIAESLVRRILRRTPRRQLPPSPLAGKSQSMYSPEVLNLAEDGNGQ
jgi:hypothetical protein